MTLTRRILIIVALASVATLAACRFNPEAAKKIVEQGKSTAEAIVTNVPADAVARATETPSAVVADAAAPITVTNPVSDAVADAAAAVTVTNPISDAVAAPDGVITDTAVLSDVVEPEVITDALEATEAITLDAASLISATAEVDADAVMSETEVISSGVAIVDPAPADAGAEAEQFVEVTVTVTKTDSGKIITQTDSIVITEQVTKTQTYAPAVSNDTNSAPTAVMSGTADTTNLVVNPQDVVTSTTQPAAPAVTPRVVTVGSDTAETPSAANTGTPRAVKRTRRATSVVCVVPSRRAVNLRRGPSRASSRSALLGPRSRFVATARSANGRWVYGASAKGRGWVAASVVNCSAAPQRLTVRR